MLALCSAAEFAAEPGRLLSAAEIAAKYRVSTHHLAKVLRTPVARTQALAQITIHGNRVQQRLEAVAGAGHGPFQRVGRVILEAGARAAGELVALVVQHMETPAVGEQQVDLAVHEPGQRLLSQRHQSVLAMRLAGLAQRPQVIGEPQHDQARCDGRLQACHLCRQLFE